MDSDFPHSKLLTDALVKLEKDINKGNELYKSKFIENIYKFESFNYCFLAIVEPFTNKEEINPLNSSVNITTNKPSHSTAQDDFSIVKGYISNFWFEDHPFIAILNLIMARLHIKTRKHVINEIEGYYRKALQISKKSLGPNNIFVANISEEIGSYYVYIEKYYEGVKHFQIAHYIYKENKDEFFECFILNLKKIVKYLIILGYYNEALDFGYKDLLYNYITLYKKIEKDKDTNNNNEFKKIINIENIVINLIYLAKTLSNYEYGVELCKILVFEDKEIKHDAYSIFSFNDWRKGTNKISSKNKEKEDIEMRKIISLYLRFVIRYLKNPERKIFTQCLVKVMEDKNEKLIVEKLQDNDKLYSDCFSNIKEDGDLYKHFQKILFTIGAKYGSVKTFQKVENSTNEIDKNYNDSWTKFRIIYKLFNQKNVFTDKDKYI